MSQPDTGDVHVNALLSQMSVGYSNMATAYVADGACPPVYVMKKSDNYAVYNRGDFFADHGNEMVRAPGTRAAQTGFGVTTNNTYSAINYAIGMLLPDELLANADEVFQLEQDATRLVTEIQMIRREREFASTAMTTSVWATDATLTKWSDYGASDPLGDIATANRTVTQAIGRPANTMVMGQIVFDRLRFHPDIMELIKYGGGPSNPAVITEQMLAGLFGVSDFLVSRSQFRESQEGEALNLDPVLDDDVLLLYREPSPSRFTPSNLTNFVWQSAVLGPAAPHFIRRWRDDPAKASVVESQSYFDMVITDAESTGPAGYFAADVVD